MESESWKQRNRNVRWNEKIRAQQYTNMESYWHRIGKKTNFIEFCHPYRETNLSSFCTPWQGERRGESYSLGDGEKKKKLLMWSYTLQLPSSHEQKRSTKDENWKESDRIKAITEERGEKGLSLSARAAGTVLCVQRRNSSFRIDSYVPFLRIMSPLSSLIIPFSIYIPKRDLPFSSLVWCQWRRKRRKERKNLRISFSSFSMKMVPFLCFFVPTHTFTIHGKGKHRKQNFSFSPQMTCSDVWSWQFPRATLVGWWFRRVAYGPKVLSLKGSWGGESDNWKKRNVKKGTLELSFHPHPLCCIITCSRFLNSPLCRESCRRVREREKTAFVSTDSCVQPLVVKKDRKETVKEPEDGDSPRQ